MMRKYRCPQCDIPSMYVKKCGRERLLVYVYENGEVVPKDPTADLSGFDLTEVFCLGCSWHGAPRKCPVILYLYPLGSDRMREC